MKTKHYLTIVSKSDFIDLYKYGYIYIRSAVNFNGRIDSIKEDEKLFEKVTATMNCYEYSFEYLMLHFTASDATKRELSNIGLDISQVQGIYSFDEEAKKEIEMSLSSQLIVHVSNWSDYFTKLQIKKYKEQSLKGIDNLWKLFNLEDVDKAICGEIINEEIISETFNELFRYERPKGDLPIWVYLLRYERHNSYPQNLKGYFCDMIHVVLNKMGKEEQIADVDEQTKISRKLSDTDFKSLIRTVAFDEKFIKKLEVLVGDLPNECKFYVSAPLYLYLRKMFSEGINSQQEICNTPFYNFIEKLKKEYGFDFTLATYMLGLTLGYDKTYEAYYSKIGLPIFKNLVKEVTLDPIETEETNTECYDSEDNNPNSRKSNVNKKHKIHSAPISSQDGRSLDSDKVFSDKTRSRYEVELKPHNHDIENSMPDDDTQNSEKIMPHREMDGQLNFLACSNQTILDAPKTRKKNATKKAFRKKV